MQQLEIIGRYRTEAQRIVCEAIGAHPWPLNDARPDSAWIAELPLPHRLDGHLIHVHDSGVIEIAGEVLDAAQMQRYTRAMIEIARRRLSNAKD